MIYIIDVCNETTTHVNGGSTMSVLPPPPSPYEYALLSEASYSDKLPSPNSTLSRMGWKRIIFIEDNGYHGNIWIHHEKKQIVIAHRGSDNVNSWIEYAHSIIRLKRGYFVNAAIDLLQHKTVVAYKNQDYRLSTTGHSLGGFLAQVCVYWAKRSDFKETFYPDMSAMVFDAPGVVDFLMVLRSSLEREQGRILIEHLNIHNFCAVPNLINTFGKHTGTLWHLSGEKNTPFDFISGHRLSTIIKGFDPKTGQPYHFRTMRDWPQADYSEYENFGKAVNQIASETVKLPFNCLNILYKKIKQQIGYTPKKTWYDQIFSDKGELSQYLHHTVKLGQWPTPQDFNQKLMLAIDAYYTVSSFEKNAIKSIDIHHFDTEIQLFLSRLYDYQPWPNDFLVALKFYYGDEIKLLKSFQIRHEGEIIEVELAKDYPCTILDFQASLQQLLNKKGIMSVQNFIINKEKILIEQVAQSEDKLSAIKKIQNNLRKI
jgi:hypothetical protein